jgi:hypothetical protein
MDFSAEACARRRLAAEAISREWLDPGFAWGASRTRREQIGDLLGRQAGARHPGPGPARSISPFA